MSNHTPGPWKIERFDRLDADGDASMGEPTQWGVWDGASFPTICRVTGAERGINRKVAKANARLIAEAPEMLAELQRVGIELAGWLEVEALDWPQEIARGMVARLQAVRAVIDRARTA